MDDIWSEVFGEMLENTGSGVISTEDQAEQPEDLKSAIERFLQEAELQYDYFDDKQNFRILFSLDAQIKELSVIIRLLSDKDCYLLSAFPVLPWENNDSEIKRTMAEFICRINDGMLFGSFGLDMNDGELAYHYFTDCDGHIPSQDKIAHSVASACEAVKKYSDGFIGIMLEIFTAEEAEEYCEKENKESS